MSLCFILAAGLGTRLRPFSQKLPKPCFPFLNLPLMNYSFYLAKQAGFDRFLFNSHHLPEKIEFYTEKLKDYCLSLQISKEHEAVGTGGAFWKAEKFLAKEDFFLVANGDSLLVPENNQVLSELIDQFQRDQSLCTLLTSNHPELLKSLKPVWVDGNRNIRAFGKTPGGQMTDSLRPVHYTGYQVFSPRIFNFLRKGPSSIFSDVLSKAITCGEKLTHFHLSSAFWYETGNFDSFLKASKEVSLKHDFWLREVHSFFNQSLCRRQKTPEDLLFFLKESPPESFPLFKGFNIVGRNVKLAEKAKVENTIVGDDCQLFGKSYKNQIVL